MSDKKHKEPYRREWSVPSNLAEIVHHAKSGYADQLDPISREESMQAFMDAEAICHRLGGMMNVGVMKVERYDGFITIGYSFHHRSFGGNIDRERQADPVEIQDPAPDLADEAPEPADAEPVLN